MSARGWTQAGFSGITAGEAQLRGRVRGTTDPACSALRSGQRSGQKSRRAKGLALTHYTTTKNAPLACDHMRARVRERVCACSGVVDRCYLSENKGEKPTTLATTQATTAPRCSAPGKKGGFRVKG